MGGVAFVEQEIEDLEHAIQSAPESFRLGRGEARRTVTKLALRAGDRLSDGALLPEQRGRDLARGQAAAEAQRHRHRLAVAQAWVAAQQDEPQRVVFEGRHLLVRRGQEARSGGGELLPVVARRLTSSELVEEAVPRDRGEPGRRVVRYAPLRPARHGASEGRLHRVLDPVERADAESSEQDRHHAPPAFPIEAIDEPGDGLTPAHASWQGRGASIEAISRTSTDPP